MTSPEPSDAQPIRDTLDKLAAAQAFEASRQILAMALQSINAGNLIQAEALCERVLELDDSFFATEALFLIAETWRRTRKTELEGETYRKIAALPLERRALADPLKLGVSLTRAGHAREAKAHYLKFLEFSPHNGNIQANLAELLLTMSEYPDCIIWSERVAAWPALPQQIIGKFFKGCALYLQGFRPPAQDQFQWIGNLLISANTVPPDFSWDFEDSRPTLEKVDLPAAQLILHVLGKQILFPEFATKWSAMFPAPSALPTGT